MYDVFYLIAFISAFLHSFMLLSPRGTNRVVTFGKIVALTDVDKAFVIECIMNNTFDAKADINHDSKVNVADLVELNKIENNGDQ